MLEDLYDSRAVAGTHPLVGTHPFAETHPIGELLVFLDNEYAAMFERTNYGRGIFEDCRAAIIGAMETDDIVFRPAMGRR